MNTLAVLVLDAGSQGGLVHGLLLFLLVAICVLAIWYVGTWFISKLGAPPMALTIWNGIFLLVGLIVFINFLLGLAGRPLFAY